MPEKESPMEKIKRIWDEYHEGTSPKLESDCHLEEKESARKRHAKRRQ